jgi:spore cortex formation protein SpoVR/YcgB (stage V sporulation)
VFEVRAVHNDLTAIHNFVDQDFVDKYEIYIWEKFPSSDGSGGFEYRIKTRNAKDIKRLLMKRYGNGGLPDIRLVDPNYANKNIFLLEHQYDGRLLMPSYASATLRNIWNIWNNGGKASNRPVAISTKNKGGKEILYVSTGTHPLQNIKMSRKDFEREFGIVLEEKEDNS